MWLLKIAVLSVWMIITSANEIKVSPTDETTSYRLPKNSIPLKYDIDLTTNIHKNVFEFTGNVKIHVKLLENSTSITLHYHKIEITKMDIFLPSLPVPIILNAAYDLIESHDFLIIKLPRIYEANTEFLIDIYYLGELRDDSSGFYRGDYNISEGLSRYYAATQFKINNARHAFPCFDEPGIRAVIQLTLRHGKAYKAISSTNILLELEDGDYSVTIFAPTPAIPTYIFAFFISDYEFMNSIGSSRISQRVYASPKNIQEGFGNSAASVFNDIFNKFEEIFEVDYPLDKLDNVALSTKFNNSKYLFGAHAMENLGLITYSSFSFLLNPDFTGNYKRQSENTITSLIAHVYANQWFGNIVTPKWWQYSWLSGGIAKLFEIYLSHSLYPNEKHMDKFFTSTMPVAFITDTYKNKSWSLNHYTEHPDELKYKFSNITYYKAACVLRMFMEVIGEDVFLNGLNIYLKNNEMSSATPENLHNALDEAFEHKNSFRLNIGHLMSTWEELPGYPLISISISGNNLVLTQRRYPESNGEFYMVPITFATKTNPDFTKKTPNLWLDSQVLSLSQSSLGFSSNDWIILNIDQVGYYRVDYDVTLWRAIIKQLNEDHEIISPINRAVLLDEIYLAWTKLNRVTAADILNSLNYLEKETDVNVWRNAQNMIRSLNFKLLGTAAYDEYLKFLIKITESHLNSVGYESIEGEDFETIRFREYTRRWNCEGLGPNCLANAFQKILFYRLGTGNSDFNFCNAIKILTPQYFSSLLNDVITDPNLDYRDDFVHYLGCSLLEENLQMLLQAALDLSNGLESYDREMFLYNMARYSNNGLKASLNFIHDNYIALANV